MESSTHLGSAVAGGAEPFSLVQQQDWRRCAGSSRTSWLEISGSNPPLRKHKKGGPAGPFFMFGGEGGMGSLRSPLLRAGALRGRTGRFEISGSNPPLRNIKKGALRTPVFIFGGEGGIRTLDTGLPYTHFPGVLLQPLGHLSKYVLSARPAQNRVRRLNHFAPQCNAPPHFPPAGTADSHEGRDSV